jgi:hypothetical protein
LSTAPSMANLEKAFKEGRMSEEMYTKNIERLKN